MKNRPWLNLIESVRAIRQALGVSGGAACTLLCQACESGVVQSRKRPWPEQPDEPPDQWSPPISKLDWYGASIDLEHGWLILSGDKLPLRADVKINADDLRYWLKSQRPGPRKQKALGKRPRVIAQLATMFSGVVPEPGDCPRKHLRRQLLERDPSLAPLDEETLKKSIEEFNASQLSDPIRSDSNPDRIVSE
jgi:hypothetical protein